LSVGRERNENQALGAQELNLLELSADLN